MSFSRCARFVLPMCAGVLALLVIVKTSDAQGEGGMPTVQATPEHAKLEAAEGVWDAKVSFVLGPGMPPAESKGVETNKFGCGGNWLLSDFEGEAMGMPFQGHGVTGYDSAKKKYVGVWVDSMSPSVQMSEGTYSADGKTRTMLSEGPNMSGAMTKHREVTEIKDADHRKMTFYEVGADGKDTLSMTIEYTRKK